MKYKFLIIFLFFATLFVSAQIHESSNGNIGIGTTSPQKKLHVKGTSLIEDGSGRSLNLDGYSGIQTQGNPHWLHINRYSNDNVAIGANSTSNVYLVNGGGKVGIGTSSPSQKFQVDALNTSIQMQLNRTGTNSGKVDIGVDSDGLRYWVGGYDGFGKEEFFIGASGNVGLGINNPSAKLHISNPPGGAALSIDRGGKQWNYSIQNTGNNLFLNNSSNPSTFFTYTNTGRFGIGTTSPDAELAVNGNIHAKEVKVDLIGWPDYVFEENYNLPSLEEVEKQIKEKGHLINIPSAAEVTENGVQLGEMNKLLLEKIEELTLYIIDIRKKNKSDIKKLQEQINALKNEKN